ncbi:MAG: FtsX-like permease family protein [Armatimonadota bacterium]|nr:FtsX-like permease family protein [Armatimonadota bacterium]
MAIPKVYKRAAVTLICLLCVFVSSLPRTQFREAPGEHGFLTIASAQTPGPTVTPSLAKRYRSITAFIDSNRLNETVSKLSVKSQSRVTGYPGCDSAAKYIQREFKKIGLKNVKAEPYIATVPIDKGASIEIGGRRFQLYGMWPNLVRTSQISPKGLNCRVVDLKYAGLMDCSGHKIEGRAALVDFNCGTDWMNAPRLGAKAVIFIEPEITMRGEAENKFSAIPVSIPRFWISKADAAELRKMLALYGEGKSALIKCEMPWERRKTLNISGIIPGADKHLRDQVIVVQAYYDGTSVVPALAPSAESSCGIAGLLEIASAFKKHPPKRTIMFVANSGHFLGLAGMRAYMDRHLEEFQQYGAREKFKGWLNRKFPNKYHYKLRNPMQIMMVAGLDLSSRTETVGVFYKGYFYDFREDIQNKYSDIGRTCYDNSQRVANTLGFNRDDRFADGINPIAGKTWRNFIPGKVAFDAEVASLAGMRGVTFASVDDARPLVDTPLDTVDKVNIPNLTKQVSMLACLLDHFARDTNKPGAVGALKMPVAQAPSPTRMGLQGGFAKLTGKVVRFDPNISFIPNVGVPNCVAVIRSPHKSFMGVRANIIEATDKDGKFGFLGVAPLTAYNGKHPTKVGAYKIDPKTGDIIYAPDDGAYGEFYPTEVKITSSSKEVPIVVFRCISTSLYDLIDPLGLKALSTLDVYDGDSNGRPRMFGSVLAVPEPMNSRVEDMAVIFSQPKARLKIIMGAGPAAKRMALLNSSKKHPDGIGYDVGKGGTISRTAYRVAKDMWTLDDSRIKTLAKYRIINEGIDDLHLRAKQSLAEAEKALNSNDYMQFDAHARAAWGYESRAYPDVQKTARDVVNGSLFYLFLMMPFAYFIERLFIASPHLKWQIVWILGIFVGIFAVFSRVHPAFDIAGNTMVVFLAFIMLALSLFVSVLVTGTFEEQIKTLNKTIGGVHKVDIGRMSVAAAAFSLGISNMRRRKARTVLTCITLVMLTFTVLSFTSIVSGMRYNKVGSPGIPAYNGIMIRTPMWDPQQDVSYRLVKDEFGSTRAVAPRAWFFGAVLGEQSFLTLRRGPSVYNAKAATGLTPEETKITHLEKALIAGRWFNADDRFSIVIPSAIADRLRIAAYCSAVTPPPPAPGAPPPPAPIMIPLPGPQGDAIAAKQAERDCWKLANKNSKYFYFGVDDKWLGKANQDGKLWVQVEYYDMPFGSISLDYTNSSSEYTPVNKVNFQGTKTWKIATFECPGADFANGQKSDFRVVSHQPSSAFIAAVRVVQDPLRVPSQVVFGGANYDVIGVMNSAKFKELKDLDGEPLTPVDFILMNKQSQQGKTSGEAGFREYTHLEPDTTFFVPYQTLMNMGAEIRSIAVDFVTPREVEGALNNLMPRLALNIYAGQGDRIFRYSSIPASSSKGFQTVFIPVLIAALIVLNTMLGSVYERIKEIGIFSSIGLAPNHIGMLFLAESMVYAIIGAVAGYLVGQGATKILTTFNLLQDLYLNFSSVSAVLSTIIVVGVVFLSTLYPAKKASEVATPSIDRNWRVPEPEGDLWKITLPFAVTGEQASGVNGFLAEWFRAYEEYSIGDFVTQDVNSEQITAELGEGYRITCKTWLAPFDLGVSQLVALETLPTTMEDVYEVVLTITRESGDISNWKRVNRRFLNTLRKQFLIWRTLRHEERERYLANGEESLIPAGEGA